MTGDETEPSTAAPAVPDGGESDDDLTLDPWGSATVSDYRSLFEEFGIEAFDELLESVPDPHYLMRRGVIFGHREYRPVLEAMANDEPAAVLSGFMPTGDPHIGHKLVFDEIIWHQQQGLDAYALIADLEAHAARGMSWDAIDEYAESYLLSLLALGFDPEEGELYRQSENRELQDLAFELGAEANFSEFQAIYGFDGETDVSHMQSVVTQMADICYPQLEEPKPTVIPVGPDQDPHVRLARDLAERMRFFKVTDALASFETTAAEFELIDWARRTLEDACDSLEIDPSAVRCDQAAALLSAHRSLAADRPVGVDGALESDAEPLLDRAVFYPDGEFTLPREPARALSEPRAVERFPPTVTEETYATAIEKLENAGKEPLRLRRRLFNRRGSAAAFEALIDAIEGEKRVYEGHVDAFEYSRAEAAELAREIELEHGGYGFLPPSSIYHRFMTGLTGGKMSSSIPASHISLVDDPEDGYEKVKSATTGGRETAAEQREKGGRADECPVYELYAYLLAADDDEFATRVYDECVGGERLCGDCKEQAAQLMREWLADHQEKRAEVADLLEQADIELASSRR